MTDRSDFATGAPTPGEFSFQSSLRDPYSGLTQEDYFELLFLGGGIDRPGGPPEEKYLQSASSFLPDYTNQLVKENPSFRVPSFGQAFEDVGYIEPSKEISGTQRRYFRSGQKKASASGNVPGLRVGGVSGTALEPKPHSFLPDRILGLYSGIGKEGGAERLPGKDTVAAVERWSKEGDHIADLIRYNLDDRYIRNEDDPRLEGLSEREKERLLWEGKVGARSTEEHESLHIASVMLRDNAALWADEIYMTDPITQKKERLFDIMTVVNPNTGRREWDREIMHMAINSLSPERMDRFRVFRKGDHRIFEDINADADMDWEKRDNSKFERVLAIVKALNSAAGILKENLFDKTFLSGERPQYGTGYKSVWGEKGPRGTARQDVGIIGR
jgi:hypothetical protein